MLTLTQIFLTVGDPITELAYFVLLFCCSAMKEGTLNLVVPSIRSSPIALLLALVLSFAFLLFVSFITSFNVPLSYFLRRSTRRLGIVKATNSGQKGHFEPLTVTVRLLECSERIISNNHAGQSIMNKEYMLRTKPKVIGVSSPGGGWEMRPGGMLVQKRNSDANLNSNTVPNIRVNVKYGSSYHEVIISSQASFGELKKILAGRTGLNMQDQKLVFEGKERDSKGFLDFCGVKNGSKILLLEDEVSMQKRRAEAKMKKALEDIAGIRFEVDNLAKQVASAEVEINGGKKVVETVLLNLIEQLMTQLIKLDGIAADGVVKLQRRMQVKRVQKYIEILDVLKMRNTGLRKLPLQQQCRTPRSFQKQKEQGKQGRTLVDSGKVVVTTKWETF